MTRQLNTLAAWADTRLAMRLSAPALARRRARLWEKMRPVLAQTPALSRYAKADLRDIPIVDPETMRADPAAWNSRGIGADEAFTAANDAEAGGKGWVRDDIVAGLSTGTAGVRGLFLASGAERSRYIGQSTARLLPLFAPLTGARIALVLRADSELYRDVGNGRFAILHLPLAMAGAEIMRELNRFQPTVLVAPPRELSALAALNAPLPKSLQRIFWGSEPMAALERAWVTERLRIRPDPIYQATEGFIGAACSNGNLHLNEDSFEIELEPLGDDIFQPVITDLRRHIQPIVRVRMGDIVQPAAERCACGFSGRVVRPVAGRIMDIWTTARGPMTPDLVDDHIVRALGPQAQWKVQGSHYEVKAEITEASHVETLRTALKVLLPTTAVNIANVDAIKGAKRRRVSWRATP